MPYWGPCCSAGVTLSEEWLLFIGPKNRAQTPPVELTVRMRNDARGPSAPGPLRPPGRDRRLRLRAQAGRTPAHRGATRGGRRRRGPRDDLAPPPQSLRCRRPGAVRCRARGVPAAPLAAPPAPVCAPQVLPAGLTVSLFPPASGSVPRRAGALRGRSGNVAVRGGEPAAAQQGTFRRVRVGGGHERVGPVTSSGRGRL